MLTRELVCRFDFPQKEFTDGLLPSDLLVKSGPFGIYACKTGSTSRVPPSTVRATDPATFLLNRAHDVTTPLGVLMDSDLATCAVTAVDASERTLTLAVTLSDGIFTLHPSNKEGPNLLQCVFDVLQYWEDEDLLKASEHTRPASAERHPQHHGNGATSNPSDAADAPWSREHMRDSIFKAMLPGDWHFEEPEPPGLQCRLFKYQRRALAWMLWREGLQADGSSTYARCADEGSVKARLPTHADVWPSVKVGSRIVSYNQLVRGLSDGTCPPPPPVPSGILADEMGLGKTVEMIALILARRRAGGGRAQPGSSNGTLAGADGAGVEGGTLVVCPPALVQQWRSELNNHAGASLNVVVYSGLRETREAEEEAQRHAEEDANGGRKRRRKNADEANVLMRLRKMNSHVTLDMVREAEFYARMAAGEDPPVDDADAYARDIARTLAAADVVLTSFDVLSKEVHYDSEKNLRPLRHAKRYKVPDCPLVLVDWHRLVVDEAQMVARFSAVSEMGGKLRAAHRWCVTGTPMTSQYEADDLHALLKFVRHEPFQWQGAWDWLIGRRLAGGYDTYDPITARKGWDTLIKTLQPLMWRTDKETVHAEFHLPPRELHVAQLALQPGEHELYEKLVQAARDTHAKVVTAEVEVAAATAGVPSGREGPAATSARSKKRLAKLQENEVDDLTQLRLACIHPQLTRFWTKDLASELQLASGGAASMNEILRQLVHKEEVELQEAERLLCANLNTLAMALMPTREVLEAGANGNNGEPGSPKGTADGTNNGGAASQQVDDGAGPSSPTAGAGDGSGHTPGKKRRTNSQLPPKEALALAIELLEDSFRVSEKGISALGVDLDKLEEMRDPMQVLATSWAAWKKVQINTGWQLVVAYELAGRSGAPLQKMRTKVAKWTGELEEQVSQELHAAALAEEDHRKKVETTGARVVAAAQKALEGGFPPVWGFTDIADPEGVLDRLHDEYRQAQGVESEQMAGKNGILGKHVHHVLMEVEKKVQADQNALEGWVAAQQAAVARAQLQSALAAVDGRGSKDEAYRDLRWQMGRWVALLKPFRRKTIESNFKRVLPQPYRVRIAIDAPAGPSDSKIGEKMKQDDAPSGNGVSAEGLANDAAAPAEAGDNAVMQIALMEDSIDFGGRHINPPDLLPLAQQGAPFIPSSSFKGGLSGYVFKTGDDGQLGYYKDSEMERPLITQIQECGAVLLRALNEHQTKMQRHIDAKDEAIFRKCGLAAVEHRLECANQHVTLVRQLRDLHVAEQTFAYKEALKRELDVEIQDAKEHPAAPMRSKEALRRLIEDHKATALKLKSKMGFMSNRIMETAGSPDEVKVDGAIDLTRSDNGSGGVEKRAEDGAPNGDGGAGGSGSTRDEMVAVEEGFVYLDGQRLFGPLNLVVNRAGIECPVCLNEFTEDIQLWTLCGHAYCSACNKTLFNLSKYPACAVCRVKTSIKHVIRVASTQASKSRAVGCDPEAETDPALSNMKLSAEWSIKLAALLRRIMALAATAPQEKVLVFSQFPEALRLVGFALQSEGIGFVELVGGRKAASKAVQEFREDDATRVFLLSHRAGAQGLTLVRANHVFLLEPALDPAIEQQAVARVHRIGQQRPVRVVRFLVQSTIEEAVLAIQESRHKLFAKEEGAGGEEKAEEEEEDVDITTTVKSPVQQELIQAEDMSRLLDAVLKGG